MLLLGGDGGKRERLLRVSVITLRILRVRQIPSRHPVLHTKLKASIKLLLTERDHSLEGRAPPIRQLAKIGRYSFR